MDAMRRPAAVDPVKVILSTRGSRTSSSETSRSAVTTLSTPGGRPAASAASAIRYPSPGASGEDLSTTVQPASRAGATLLLIRSIGTFHGMIAPTTPTGSRTIRPNFPADGLVGSSNGNVSASAANPAKVASAPLPLCRAMACSTPASRGQTWPMSADRFASSAPIARR
jgi:hypothetical protein